MRGFHETGVKCILGIAAVGMWCSHWWLYSKNLNLKYGTRGRQCAACDIGSYRMCDRPLRKNAADYTTLHAMLLLSSPPYSCCHCVLHLGCLYRCCWCVWLIFFFYYCYFCVKSALNNDRRAFTIFSYSVHYDLFTCTFNAWIFLIVIVSRFYHFLAYNQFFSVVSKIFIPWFQNLL